MAWGKQCMHVNKFTRRCILRQGKNLAVGPGTSETAQQERYMALSMMT